MCRVHGCMHVFNKLNSCYVHRDKHFGAAFVCPRQGCSAKYPWASQFKKHLRSKEKCDKFALSMSTPADWVPYVRNREDTWFKAGVITGKPYRPR
ncbi:hypothetical protein DENSPDRAFT_832107 [Dentipellis sp. KUC8613]|nr:hypothetical protein DENSPDRAFT_832107 [Dentipellis sp. KUC8613]